MANSYFRFKQFTVHQERAAMKVCTDSCLFGAWVASKIKSGISNILDVGCGTGLLSLMLAQKTNASVHAIDIDAEAVVEAGQNFEKSPWSGRLSVSVTSVQKFLPAENFDLMICNPPFYENDLKSPDRKRTLALHNDSLPLQDLLTAAGTLLKSHGHLAVLLPSRRREDFEVQAAESQFKIRHWAAVHQSVSHPVFRYMYLLEKDEQISDDVHYENIFIRDDQQNYTPAFLQLLKDYYLFEN